MGVTSVPPRAAQTLGGKAATDCILDTEEGLLWDALFFFCSSSLSHLLKQGLMLSWILVRSPGQL